MIPLLSSECFISLVQSLVLGHESLELVIGCSLNSDLQPGEKHGFPFLSFRQQSKLKLVFSPLGLSHPFSEASCFPFLILPCRCLLIPLLNILTFLDLNSKGLVCFLSSVHLSPPDSHRFTGCMFCCFS